MHRNTWKQGERRIATHFNTFRTPLSGGSSRHTRSDTLHEKLFIEIKHRQHYPLQKLWLKTLEEAKLEKKTPLIVFNKKNNSEPLMMCRLSDIKKINDEVKDEIFSAGNPVQ